MTHTKGSSDSNLEKVIEVQTEKQFKSDPEKLRSYERIKALELAISFDSITFKTTNPIPEQIIKTASKFYQFLSGKDKAYYQPATQKQLTLLMNLDYRSYWPDKEIEFNTLSKGEAKELIEELSALQPKDLDQQFKEHNERES